MAALATPFIARSAFAAGRVIRASTPGPDTEWQSKGLYAFKQSLEEALPGAFDVQLHFNGTLFSQGTEIEAMQRGNLEIALTSPSDIAELIPEYSIFTTGYLFRDAAHLDAVYDESDVGTEFKGRVADDLQLHVLRSEYLGARHVMLRAPREVNVPDDLKGVKLRMPGSASWQFLGNALGASATPLAFEEVYLALQTGTIDGLENPLPDAIASKFYEVTRQVVLTSHQVANLFFTMPQPFWNSLTGEEQEAINAAVAANKTVNDEGILATEAEGVAFFEAHDNIVTTPDVEAFRAHVLDAFINSDFSVDWPEGMLERIEAV
ncbi:MAG: TRAP transporter substrate-binding protein DctP [Rhodocyclaceae bacterium]|nr:TRAP transporter substrate-binding protein DctP [Rhodocyclaceae bacterium]